MSNPFANKTNSQNNENKKNDNKKQNNQPQKTSTSVSDYPMLLVYERKEDRQGKQRSTVT